MITFDKLLALLTDLMIAMMAFLFHLVNKYLMKMIIYVDQQDYHQPVLHREMQLSSGEMCSKPTLPACFHSEKFYVTS